MKADRLFAVQFVNACVSGLSVAMLVLVLLGATLIFVGNGSTVVDQESKTMLIAIVVAGVMGGIKTALSRRHDNRIEATLFGQWQVFCAWLGERMTGETDVFRYLVTISIMGGSIAALIGYITIIDGHEPWGTLWVKSLPMLMLIVDAAFLAAIEDADRRSRLKARMNGA